jgi:hypothetical protein
MHLDGIPVRIVEMAETSHFVPQLFNLFKNSGIITGGSTG